MPSYVPRPQTGYLTPLSPDYIPKYGNNAVQTQLPSMGQQAYHGRHYDNYRGPYAPAAAQTYSQQMQSSYGVPVSDHYATQAIAAIAPLNIGSEQINSATRRQETQHQQPKEEKAVGGVAAHLDYEMEEMASFVADMAQKMYDLMISGLCLADIDISRSVQSSVPVTAQFRKFVSSVLSSTRLPSSTILLGLHFLSSRMQQLSGQAMRGEIKLNTSSGYVYRMLTISLVLASKFLDDNTFQNRSWAEVTSLPVVELNSLELEWLTAINWKLHVDPHDTKGFMAWRSQWESRKNSNARSQAAKLTPINTNISAPLNNSFSPQPMYPQYNQSAVAASAVDRQQMQAVHQSAMRYDSWGGYTPQLTNERSPPSAPHTGPTTPEYYGLPSVWGTFQQPPAYSLRQTQANGYPHVVPSQAPAYHHSSYAGPQPWGSHRQEHNNYPLSFGYGQQSVVG
jgi:Cyclin